METVEYRFAGRRFEGVLVPSEGVGGAGPSAAVVLSPDWQGAGPLARDHAQHLASLGYTVLIADLYGEGFLPSGPEEVGPLVRRLIESRHLGAGALGSAVERLRGRLPDATPVVCVGYSAGAMISLDLARASRGAGLAGVVLCSGLLKTAAEGMPTVIDVPVLVLQGTHDQVSPLEVVEELVSEMDAAGNDVRVLLMAGTHHGFDNPAVGTDPGARLVYSERSAARARHAIADFIDEVAIRGRFE